MVRREKRLSCTLIRPQPPPLLGTKTTAMAGSSETKWDAFRYTMVTLVAVPASRLSAVIAQRQLGTAARLSEYANYCSNPVLRLVLDRIAVVTADVTHVPIGWINRPGSWQVQSLFDKSFYPYFICFFFVQFLRPSVYGSGFSHGVVVCLFVCLFCCLMAYQPSCVI